ncbi:beta-lactamase/transpeptidase-like protein [Collybia nuda]|uniref:Beta-lactamase/transpeptidase-like protein n=1 Tax=Collybia nuda TaxID=64659 RepID=A0A9P6CF72_9AGAR|nr:beta-lactamase/transpeptidase-like protein [Collybia nuda]
MYTFKLVIQTIYGTLAIWQALIQGKPKAYNVLTKETDAFIETIISDWNTPGGVAVAVVKKNSQGIWDIETRGYGRANLGGAKVTENTRFAIGSNSKLFTTLAVGLLIHNETLSPRLSWESTVASVIPSWELMDPVATKQTTILDIMSHRTGLPRHDFSPKASDDVLDVIKKLKFHKPSAKFREVWQYNNNMYTVLSHLPPLLLKSRISFAQYVKENILDPLGMNSTTYSFDVSNATGQLAEGMIRQGVDTSKNPFGDGIIRSVPFTWLDAGGEDGDYSGNGGVISTVKDMATWLQTLLLGGTKPGTNVSVIPVEAVEKVSTGFTVKTGQAPFPERSPSVYGGGQARGTYRGHEIIEHGGSVLGQKFICFTQSRKFIPVKGFNTQITCLPSDNLGIAVLSNDHTYGSSIMEIIKYRLLDESLGLTGIDWNSRYKAMIAPPQDLVKKPVDPSPPFVDFTILAGTYNNPGYGKVELCLVSNNTSLSKSCQTLISKSSRILPGGVESGVPTFLGEFNALGMTYIRISHYDGNTFNITGLNSFATGDPAKPYWVFSYPSPSDGNIFAEFAVDGNEIGFGLTGIWGAGKDILGPKGNTMRERAEAWFTKL